MALSNDPIIPSGELARISARTERLALDWSLVLASQGISAVIERHPEAGWGLLVPVAELSRANDAIELYRRENRRWPWQRALLKQKVIFDWAATLWLALTCVAFQLQSSFSRFYEAGVLDSAAVARGEWWRCFTAELLHGDLLHLATNSVFGMLLLGLAMGRFGTGLGLLAAYLAGTAGNVFSWLVYRETHLSLGASGVVMGALGLLAAQSFGAFRADPRGWKAAIAGLAAGSMLFVLLGLNPGTDIAAHFGGFVAGALLGVTLVSFHRLSRQPLANLVAGLLFAFLVIWPWAAALKTHSAP
jgi:rhomboid protease GluP